MQATTEVEPFEDRWRATQLQSGSSLVSASITCLPPRYVADFLVQIFFNYAQTNNFYVEEDWLQDKVNICYTNPSSLSSDDAGAVCALLMVLAVGTQFAHMESTTPVNRPPPTAATTGRCLPGGPADAVRIPDRITRRTAQRAGDHGAGTRDHRPIGQFDTGHRDLWPSFDSKRRSLPQEPVD